jgi:hypothetical protein
MTQAFNLSQLANYVNTSGQLDASTGLYNEPIPSGTVMLFVQTAAPAGWTKSTTNNDKALRVVSGTASTGGTVAFSTAFANGTTGSTTLTTTQIPSHTHLINKSTGGVVAGGAGMAAGATNTTATSQATGGGLSHDHSLNIDVQYVDVIIATKN